VLGTYASTLVVIGSAVLVGQAVLVVCGWRRPSWIAPVVGLGPILALAWGAIQLPGEGATGLGAIALLSAVSVVVLVGRLRGVGAALRDGIPIAAITLLAASIPFIVEGRFGVLGTGFNVDMSQHLFAADWLAGADGAEPGLVKQGYPLGPHALAIVGAEAGGGNLVQGFGGLTIAVPVLAALCALAVLRELPPLRRAVGAVLVALPYLVASYLAQGQIKELLQGFFLLGFALCLHELAAGPAGDDPPRRRLLAAVPLAAIALGSLYSYSAPGLAWLGGAAVLFAAAELYRRREQGVAAVVLGAVLPVAIGLAVLFAGIAPELGRVVEFQGSAVKVASGGDRAEPPFDRPSRTRERGQDGGGGGGDERDERSNNELGNLFNEISPPEALGIWPSGDFRVDPGGGAVPGAVFYLGAALAVLAFLLGLARWLPRGETAVPAALAAAVAIWFTSWAVATPYTAAKALMMVAPLAMLVSVRELVSPEVLSPRCGSRGALAPAVVGVAFVLGAGASSLLALGNAPVGPEEYSSGLARVRSIFERRPTLVLADPEGLASEHGRDFLAWEARGGEPVCIEPATVGNRARLPEGIQYVVTTLGESEPPFAGLSLRSRQDPYALWERRGAVKTEPPQGEVGNPSECGLALG
jgi:hypothetical protein